MLRFFFLLQCYCFCLNFLYSQQPEVIQPSWVKTFGDHKFTNRDQLTDLKRNRQGNIFGILETERDSTSSDVSIIQLNGEGILQWEYRFSSGFQHDYDIPLFLEFADDGGVYFGTTNDGSVSQPFRRARIGKVDKSGHLAWTRDLNQVLFPHEAFNHIFAFTDNWSNLHVTYNLEHWTPDGNHKIACFLVFNPAGDLIENIQVPEIAKFLQEDGYIAFQTRGADDENVLLLVGPIAPLTMALRIVGTDKDTIIPVPIPAALQNAVKYDGEFRVFRTDPAGNIYISQDAFGDFSFPLHIYKITLEGAFSEVFSMPVPAGAFLQGSDFFCSEDAIYLTGRQTNYLGFGTTFIKKINYSGKVVNEKKYTYPTQVVRPMRIYNIPDSVYVTIQNRSLETLKILGFDENLQDNGTFDIDVQAFENIGDVELLPLAKNQFISAFNTYNRNYPQSQAWTENDVLIKKLDFSLNKELWSYKYQGLGTSHVNECQIRADLKGNLFVLKSELPGPVFWGVSSRPNEYTLYKYHFNGNLLWKYVLPDSIDIYTPNEQHFQISKDGNVLLIYTDIVKGTSHLVEISSQGLIKHIFSGITMGDVLEAKDGRKTIVENYADGKRYVNTVDINNNLLNHQEVNGDVRALFQLPGNDVIYWLVHDAGTFFDDPKTLYLYADGNLVWEKSMRIENERETLINISYDPDNGNIFYTTRWGDNRKSIHRILISGEERHTNLQYEGEWHNIFVLDDRILLVRNEDLQVWDDTLGYHSTQSILPSYNNRYQIVQNHLLLATDTLLRIFDKEGSLLNQYRHEWITAYSVSAPDADGHLSFFAGGWYGAYLEGTRQWKRWRLAKFDLDKLASGINTELEEPDHFVEIYPNPADDRIILDFIDPLFLSQNLDIVVLNALGVVCQRIRVANAHRQHSLSVSGLSPGLYFCVIRANGQFYRTKFSKI